MSERAFPIPPPTFSPGGDTYCAESLGMTLRDYFAAKAMQGMLATDYRDETAGLWWELEETLAEVSYQIADEMLKVREQ